MYRILYRVTNLTPSRNEQTTNDSVIEISLDSYSLSVCEYVYHELLKQKFVAEEKKKLCEYIQREIVTGSLLSR